MNASSETMGHKRVTTTNVPGWWRRLSFMFFAGSGRIKLYGKLARILRRPNANVVGVIKDLYQRAYARSKIDSTTVVLAEVCAILQDGKPLSDACASFATPIEIMLLKGGEQAGAGPGATEEGRRTGLQRALEKILLLYSNQKKTRRALRSAYGSLALYMAMIIASLLTLSDYVVPKIALVFPPSHWHNIAWSMYAVGEVVNTVAFSIIMAIVVTTMIAIPFTFPYWRGRLRGILDRIPPFSFYRLQEGGGWLMSIPALTESGHLKAYDALVQTATVAKPWLREHILRISNQMEKGKQLGAAMVAAGEFPDREIVADVKLYESQGLDIDTVLKEIAAEWSESGTEMIEAQAKVLEQLALVAFAALLVWFTLGTVILQIQLPAYFMSLSGV